MTDGLNWTQEQLEAYQAKRGKAEEQKHEPDEGLESRLQAKIEKHLDGLGYYYFHDRSRKVNKPGHPDLIIACPGGRTLWLELKARGGKLSDDQQVVQMKLMYLKHEFYEIRSFKRFIEVLHREIIDIKEDKP